VEAAVVGGAEGAMGTAPKGMTGALSRAAAADTGAATTSATQGRCKRVGNKDSLCTALPHMGYTSTCVGKG
jgi:hypothetical protein